jgi:hypothetical protein
MLTSLEEIADWIAKLQAGKAERNHIQPRRADLLIAREKSDPVSEALLRQQAGDGQRDLLTMLANSPQDVRLRFLLVLRSNSDWRKMIDFAERVDKKNGDRSFSLTPEVGQQVAMALNRSGASLAAEELLRRMMAEHGRDSESLGILGRVYKDRWLQRRDRDPLNGFFFGALEWYWEGVKCNPSEVYPAINVLTLLKVASYNSRTLDQLARHIKQLLSERPKNELDYFDYATWVEVFAVTGELAEAFNRISDATKAARARWELETTAQNLSLLPEAVGLVDYLRQEAARRPTTAAPIQLS